MNRAQVINQMRENQVALMVQVGGMTRADAVETFDLALHACEEGQRTMQSVVERSPNPRVALVIASAMMALAMEETGRIIEGRASHAN